MHYTGMSSNYKERIIEHNAGREELSLIVYKKQLMQSHAPFAQAMISK